MTRASKALIVLLVVVLGAWGCAKAPAPHSAAQAERLRTLEAKCVKMEDDYRSVVSARDQLRKHMTSLEAENARLEKVRVLMVKELEQAKAIAQERDQLRAVVETRTSERDVLQVRCARLKKGLQTILGEDDTMATSTAAPVSSAPVAKAGGQS